VASGYYAGLVEMIAEVEPLSFWFRARNRLIVSMVRRHAPEAQSLLEVGCGTGFVLSALREAFPGLHLVGAEPLSEGLEVAQRRLPDVELRSLDAAHLPYEAEFDVVGAFDVLEHIEDDMAALRSAAKATRRGGVVILLVPQHPRLWSRMDTIGRHVRRYTRRGLLTKVRGAGLEPVQTSSFVSALLPAMIASRGIRRVLRCHFDPVAELRPGRLNALFERILDGERRLIERGISLPVGGSLLVVARKAAPHRGVPCAARTDRRRSAAHG
jgi:SAM-dependent methyltransferase